MSYLAQRVNVSKGFSIGYDYVTNHGEEYLGKFLKFMLRTLNKRDILDIKSDARLSSDFSPKNKSGVTPRRVLALRGLLFP